MKKPDSDQIRAYVKGKMSSEEKAAFERLLSENPEWQREVNFAKLMLTGLEEFEHQKADKKRKWLNWAIISMLLIVSALVWYQVFSGKKSKKLENGNLERVENLQSPPEGSIEKIGGSSRDLDYAQGTAICWTQNGEMIITGVFKGLLEFGDKSLLSNGGKDIFLANCLGGTDCFWVQNMGGEMDRDISSDIDLDSQGNIYMSGGFANTADFGDTSVTAKGKMDTYFQDYFIAKYSPEGKLLWIDHGGGNQIPDLQTGPNFGKTVTVDGEDNVIVSGMYIGSPKFGDTKLPVGGPNQDMYIAKYSSNGIIKWVQPVTGQYMVFANGMTTDRNGNILLTGFFGHHNLSGTVTFGDTTLISYGGRDIFVVKYDPTGQLLWAKQAGSKNLNGRDYGTGIAVDDFGNCVVTGWFEGKGQFGNQTMRSAGGRDVFIAKFGVNGEMLWAQKFGSSENDHGSEIAVDDSNNIYVVGEFTNSIAFGQTKLRSNGKEDAFIAKFDPQGKFIWARAFGGNSESENTDAGSSISINTENQIIMTGFFTGKIQIGDFELISSGKADIYIIKMDSDGNLVEVEKASYFI